MKNLELEFRLERERKYLEKNPGEAKKLAIEYLEDWLQAAKKIKELERKIENLMADNQLLTLQLIREPSAHKELELPPFLGSRSH